MESPEFAHNDKLSYRYKSIHEVMKMSRRARQRSGTDIYHVILRGINRQQIFYDEEDYDYFIRLLNRFQKVSQYEVYAYCLMGNHIHLLIKVHQESLGTIFQRIGASFVYWYNLKYQRVGHLFQDRFKSEPVENERYFLTVMRYIFRNPVKAGICTSPFDYPYSNAKAVISQGGPAFPCDITDDELADFIAQEHEDICMDISEEPRRGVTESAAKNLIRKEFGTLFPTMSKENRQALNASIIRLVKQGVSIRQLSRLTGISKSIIERAIK